MSEVANAPVIELKGQRSVDSRDMTVSKIEIVTKDDKKWNIEEMVMDFEYFESIEAPFLRCDFTILDAVDFNLKIQGGEKINVNITTGSAIKDEKLKITMQVYKIGSIVKSERGQMYVLYTVSPEMYNNEQFKVFKAFGPGSKNDKDNVPLHICKEFLKADKKINEDNFENHTKYTFISPSWKPVDAIMFLSDKITRLKNSRGSDKQSGYLFWENVHGFNFRSIDSIAEGGATKNVYTYSYTQKGTEPANKQYTIENIQYPDKANHLKSMRMGIYKSAAIGITLPAPKDAFAPNSNSTENQPGGTMNKAQVMTYEKLFSKATTVEKVPPFETPEFLSESEPTRIKYRVLPGMKNQATRSAPKNGTDSDRDYMAVAEYASARYTLLKTIQLSIEVPGNVGLVAGSLIKLVIPGSRQKGANVKQDRKFSGLYVIAGLKHIYKRDGMTTSLELVRDSLPRSGDVQ